jgi:hypothetical protein
MLVVAVMNLFLIKGLEKGVFSRKKKEPAED